LKQAIFDTTEVKEGKLKWDGQNNAITFADSKTSGPKANLKVDGKNYLFPVRKINSDLSKESGWWYFQNDSNSGSFKKDCGSKTHSKEYNWTYKSNSTDERKKLNEDIIKKNQKTKSEIKSLIKEIDINNNSKIIAQTNLEVLNFSKSDEKAGIIKLEEQLKAAESKKKTTDATLKDLHEKKKKAAEESQKKMNELSKLYDDIDKLYAEYSALNLKKEKSGEELANEIKNRIAESLKSCGENIDTLINQSEPLSKTDKDKLTEMKKECVVSSSSDLSFLL
jgi:predicted  nucleic acid-binding Zn-ribbon protein